jgi:hypothetical protein
LAAPSAIGADREEIGRTRAEVLVGLGFIIGSLPRFGWGFILRCGSKLA